MKDTLQNLTSKIQPAAHFARRYIIFVLMIVFALIYIGLVLHINSLANSQPSQAKVDSQLGQISRPKIDQPTLNKIQQLQDQNIQVKALFDQARNNPFSE